MDFLARLEHETSVLPWGEDIMMAVDDYSAGRGWLELCLEVMLEKMEIRQLSYEECPVQSGGRSLFAVHMVTCLSLACSPHVFPLLA